MARVGRGGEGGSGPEERGRGRSVRVALERALLAVGPGIINAGFTAAAAFLALTLTDFQGLRELGLISGVGILLALVKPQFEVGKGEVGKGGVVRDPTPRRGRRDRACAPA